jgi:hypothetical protein
MKCWQVATIAKHARIPAGNKERGMASVEAGGNRQMSDLRIFLYFRALSNRMYSTSWHSHAVQVKQDLV